MRRLTKQECIDKLNIAINGLDDIITTHSDSGTLKRVARLTLEKIIELEVKWEI